MFTLSRQRLLAAGLAILCALGGAWLTLEHFVPAPPKKITVAAGSKGGAYEYYAQKYREILARHKVTLEVRSTEGTIENLKLLQDPTSGVSVGFVQGGVSNSSQAPDPARYLSLWARWSNPMPCTILVLLFHGVLLLVKGAFIMPCLPLKLRCRWQFADVPPVPGVFVH